MDDKFFNINSEFELKVKPPWLDSFRAKYDKPYRYHVTFKSNTKLSGNWEDLKKDLATLAKKHQPIEVVFDHLAVSTTSKGGIIMITASNEMLNKLQKEVVEHFSKYGQPMDEENNKFESNFTPHITIARHLSSEQLEHAKAELGKDIRCEATIDAIQVNKVKEDTVQGWLKSETEVIKFNSKF